MSENFGISTTDIEQIQQFGNQVKRDSQHYVCVSEYDWSTAFTKSFIIMIDLNDSLQTLIVQECVLHAKKDRQIQISKNKTKNQFLII